MCTWLKLLPLELQEVEDFVDNPDEPGPGETVVGVMSDDLKRIYALRVSNMIKATTKVLESALKPHNSRLELLADASRLEYQANALDSIFWIGINDEFGLWDKPNVGIRKGFQVVHYEDKQ